MKARPAAQTDIAAQAVLGPELPDREPAWHPSVASWWADLRASPQALFYTPMDWHQALDLLPLRQEYAERPSGRLWVVIERASIGLGLTKADQRRNGWKLNVAVPMPALATAPLPQPAARPVPRRVADPRRVLRSVPVAGGRKRKSA